MGWNQPNNRSSLRRQMQIARLGWISLSSTWSWMLWGPLFWWWVHTGTWLGCPPLLFSLYWGPFLGPVIHYNSCICDCSIFYYLVDFIPCREFDCLCSFCIFVSLGKVTKFSANCLHPNLAEKGLADELVLFCDGPVCYWMYHIICHFFNVEGRLDDWRFSH